MSSILRRAPQQVLRVLESATDPAAVAQRAVLYAKAIAGVTQLFTRSSSGVIKQLTPFTPTQVVQKGIFGDGYLGAVVVAGTTTMSRDWYVDTLTVQAGGVLNTNGFRLYAKTAIYNSGTIRNNATTTGGATGNLFGGGNGGGSGGGAGVSVTRVPLGYAGVGGVGGNGTAGPGGAGGTATPLASNLGSLRDSYAACIGAVMGSTVGGGGSDVQLVGGGPGGGGGGNSATLTGGGGGGGGGVVLICAREVYNGGAIEARGGNGVSRTDAGRAGGGGGAGGVVLLVVDNYYGATPDVSGGAPGTSGAGATVGTAGGSGLVIGPIPG